MHTFSPNTKAKSSQVNENFTDLSTGDADVDNNSLLLYRAETQRDFVFSGCVWSVASGLNGSMTTGVIYIKDNNGKAQRVIPTAVTSRAFTASKDTYVDIDYTGTITYTEVANGATPPAMASYSLRLGMLVTSGAAITKIFDKAPRNPDEIARCTLLLGVTDVLTVENIPECQRLRYSADIRPASTNTLNGRTRFNNDSGANYSHNYSQNFGAASTGVSVTSLTTYAGTGNYHQFIEAHIENIETLEKIGYSHAVARNNAGAGVTPVNLSCFFKWANTTDLINRIDIINDGTDDFTVGSRMIVYGEN